MASKKDRLTNELSKYVGLGQWAKAVHTLQNLIELEPTNSHYHLRMGDYSLKAGNKTAAIKYYYQAADMYVKAGFSVKAIATYKMILKIAPNEKDATALMKSISLGSEIAFSQELGPDLQPAAASPTKSAVEISVTTEEREAEGGVSATGQPESVNLTADLDPASSEAVANPEFSSGGSVSLDPPSSANDTVVGFRPREKKNINVLFACFTREEFGALVDKLEPLEFMDGERIIAEGDEGDGMYLITRGAGKVVKEHKRKEVELCELGEGEFFGELSLLSGGLRSASVFAKGQTEALRLKSVDLFEVIKQYPRLESVLEQFSHAMKEKMRQLPE